MAFNPPPPSYVPDDNDKNKNPTPSAGYSTNTANYGFQPNNDTWATPNADTEAFGASGFDNDQVRGRFVKKVTGILGIQLLITFGMTLGASGACQETNEVTGQNACMGVGLYSLPLVFTSMIGSMVLLFGALCCCQSLLRKSPQNYAFLFVWTLFESHLVSFIALKYETSTVCLAMGITAGIVLFVSCLVWFTSFDFTKLLPVMMVVLLVWFLVTFIGRLVFGNFGMNTLYAGIGCTIFTVFLAIDIKLITGGGRYELSEDDYVLGAIYIYLDIINIFLYVLQFLGGSD